MLDSTINLYKLLVKLRLHNDHEASELWFNLPGLKLRENDRNRLLLLIRLIVHPLGYDLLSNILQSGLDL